MVVYNENKEILNEYNLNEGYLVPSTIVKTIPAIEGIKEQGHYETVKEYENGGKDVKWVVDVKGVDGQPEKTIIEDIYIYKEYTFIERLNQERLNLIEWYNIEYTKNEQKYRRLHSLNKLTDNGTDPYIELINLYNEAEIKRARIQEIERLLSENA